MGAENRKNKKVIFNFLIVMALTYAYILLVFILPKMLDDSMRNTINTINDYFVIPVYILSGIIIGLSSWKAVLKRRIKK
ncbi:hypothetical protein PDQ79_23565 [Bacillus cereus]|nr:hypothetical protein [Bacillus cereus]